METVRWMPFRDFDSMEKWLRHLDVGPTVLPAADVFETGNELVIQLEVPGFEEKDIDVEMHDHMLSVKGERKEETDTKEKTYRLHQRLEDTFERRFELPSDTDGKSVKGKMNKGVLEITVKKATVDAPRKIPITK